VEARLPGAEARPFPGEVPRLAKRTGSEDNLLEGGSSHPLRRKRDQFARKGLVLLTKVPLYLCTSTMPDSLSEFFNVDNNSKL
jgi:hypothetical protein